MLFKPHSALVLVGHGSTLNPDSSTPTFEQADRIRARNVFAEVQCAFWKEEPSLREILRMIEAAEVYVVPNFISEGYFTRKIIPRELELTGPVTRRANKTIKYCEPVGNDPRMADLLLQRASEAASGVPLSEATLMIVGHGTDLNENSAVAAKNQVSLIRQRNIFAEVLAAYMEEEPKIEHWQSITSQRYVIVVPFFIADGLHSYQDIPVMLGIEAERTAAASQREIFRRNPYRVGNRELYYTCSIGAAPMVADIILDTVERFDQRQGAKIVA
ncbi:MAG: CbiX/SirB N-terminal domain-containing protein [Chthoniobacterales bacterium]